MSVVQHAQSTGSVSGTISATLPSAPTAGNKLVCVINAAISGTITGPSGWTTRQAQANWTGAMQWCVFELDATGTTSATVSASLSVTARYAMLVVELPAGSFDARFVTATTTTASYSVTGLTTGAHDTVLGIILSQPAVDRTYSWDNGFTEITSVQTSHSPTNGAGIELATKDVASGTAVGTSTVTISGSTSVIGLVFAYSGAGTTPGTATGSLGGMSGSAAGVRTEAGTASGSLGGVAGAASGIRTDLGSATGTLGGVTGHAIPGGAIVGTATGALGGIEGAVTGIRTDPGTATGSLGALTGSAGGVRVDLGSATGTLGSIDGSATGTASGTPVVITQPFFDFIDYDVLAGSVTTPVVLGADHIQWGFLVFEGEAQDGGQP